MRKHGTHARSLGIHPTRGYSSDSHVDRRGEREQEGIVLLHTTSEMQIWRRKKKRNYLQSKTMVGILYLCEDFFLTAIAVKREDLRRVFREKIYILLD